MPIHRIEPTGQPDDHDDAIPLEEPEPEPVRRAPPPAPRPPAPGVVFTQNGAVAVRKDQARVRKDAECPNCKYSIVGITSARCPECGVELLPAIAAAARAAKTREGLRHEYTAAFVVLAFAVLCLSAVVTLTAGAAQVPIELLGLAIITPMAFVAYLICCTLWIGFDMPLGITAARLAAVYAWAGVTVAVFHVIFPYVPIVGWIFSLFVMYGLLIKWLDIDFIDAFAIAFVTNCVAFVVMMAMAQWS